MSGSFAAPMIDLSGQTALVTGGARGIGFGIASTLAAAGARVAVNDIDPDAAARAAHEIGGSAFAAPGDVSDETAAEAIVAAVEASSGLDLLINNAGIAEALNPIGKQKVDDWQRVIDVNLRGSYLMSRAAAPSLRRRGAGSIVNLASIAGIGGFPASHAYGVSKAAIVMLTKTLACELARHAIRVNAVAPGVIDAPMLDHVTVGGERLPAILARVPLGRLGTPADIGAAVAFLCSAAAAYITGTVLAVDGGWLAFAGAGNASGVYPKERGLE